MPRQLGLKTTTILRATRPMLEEGHPRKLLSMAPTLVTRLTNLGLIESLLASTMFRPGSLPNPETLLLNTCIYEITHNPLGQMSPSHPRFVPGSLPTEP